MAGSVGDELVQGDGLSCWGRLVLFIGILMGLAAAGGLVFLLLVSRDDSEASSGSTTIDESGPSATEPEPQPAPAPDPSSDALCGLHERLVAAIDPIGAVDGPAELEAHVLAQLAFYAAAAAVAGQPDAVGFQAMFRYYDALRAFHEPRGWNPRVEFADVVLMPMVPGDAATVVAAALETRCGVIPPRETDG